MYISVLPEVGIRFCPNLAVEIYKTPLAILQYNGFNINFLHTGMLMTPIFFAACSSKLKGAISNRKPYCERLKYQGHNLCLHVSHAFNNRVLEYKVLGTGDSGTSTV